MWNKFTNFQSGYSSKKNSLNKRLHRILARGGGKLSRKARKNLFGQFWRFSPPPLVLKILLFYIKSTTVVLVGNYINTMKATFDFNFDLYQAVKQHGYTSKQKSREAVNQKSFSLITCKLVVRKKLVNNQNLNKKVVFIVLI